MRIIGWKTLSFLQVDTCVDSTAKCNNQKSFYEDGVLESDGKYIEGKKDGKWTYYNKEEKAVKREWYENGKMTKVKE